MAPGLRAKEMRMQVGRGLGPRQIHKRHAAAIGLRPSMMMKAMVAETAVAAQGIRQLAEHSKPALQCVRKEATEIVCKNLDAVAQDVPYAGFWEYVKTFPKRNPFLTNVLLSITGYGAADYSVQRMTGDGKVDEKRVANFALFGLVQGCVSWVVFVNIFSKLAPASVRFSNLSFADKIRYTQGQKDVLKQVLLDNFVYTPLVFFPIFYSCKAAVQNEPGAVNERALQAGRKYVDNMLEDNLVSCKVWLLADILIFTVPAWMRMPAFQLVGFSFTMILSHMRGASSMDAVQQPQHGLFSA